ncbi:MAG: oligosaccharide flippase family protein [Nitrososphaerota archaeon]
MSISRKVSAAVTYNTIRIVISTLLSIFYSIITVRWLQIQNFGGYGFLDGIFSILATIYVLGTHAPLLRFIPEFMAKRDYPRLRKLLSSLQKINLAGSCIATLIIFLGADVFLGALGRPELAFYARRIALGIVPRAVLGITKNILNSLYEQKFLSIFETFFSALEFFLLIIFVVFLKLELTGIIIIGLITNSTAATVYSLYVRRKHAQLFNGEEKPLGTDTIQRIIKYTTPLTVLDLVGSFLSSAGNIILGALRNLEDVAYYDIPNSFVERVFLQAWLVIGTIGSISLTEIRYSNEGRFRFAIEQYVKLLSLYAFPVTVGGVVLAEPILLTLYGSKVLPSVQIFRILLLAYCPLKILAISDTILRVTEKTHILLFGGIARSAIIIVLGFWLVPNLGATGAAISAITSSAIVIASYVYIIAVRNRLGNFIPIGVLGKYLLSSLLMGAVLGLLHHLLGKATIPLLLTAFTIGPLTYALALRFVNAFDLTDKKLIMDSKIPFKSVILKLLWKNGISN